MTEQPTVAVVGSVNLDLTATVPRLPVAGETITGAKLNARIYRALLAIAPKRHDHEHY